MMPSRRSDRRRHSSETIGGAHRSRSLAVREHTTLPATAAKQLAPFKNMRRLCESQISPAPNSLCGTLASAPPDFSPRLAVVPGLAEWSRRRPTRDPPLQRPGWPLISDDAEGQRIDRLGSAVPAERSGETQ